MKKSPKRNDAFNPFMRTHTREGTTRNVTVAWPEWMHDPGKLPRTPPPLPKRPLCRS